MRRLIAAGLGAALLALPACGGDDDQGFDEGALVPIEDLVDEDSTGDADAGGGVDVDVAVRVRGPVIRVGEVTRICSAILESFPPQCGEPSLIVEGWDIDSDPRAQTEGDVSWVEDVELRGPIHDGVLQAAAG